jgi:hypothetical protein
VQLYCRCLTVLHLVVAVLHCVEQLHADGNVTSKTYCYLKVVLLSLWGALSDERSGLSLSVAIYQYVHQAFAVHAFYSSAMYIQYNFNSVASVRKLTIPTERPPLVSEVSASFLRIETKLI